jgi:hypothetical protein
MKFAHLETVALRQRTLVRPAGACGNMGSHNGILWSAVTLTHRQARDARKVRNAWNAANPQLVAGSVNAPAIAGVAP